MKIIGIKVLGGFIFLSFFLFASCFTLSDGSISNDSSVNQNLSQSQLNLLIARYDLIYENSIAHEEREWIDQDDVIIMIAYVRWLIKTNQTIEYNIRRDMNNKIRAATLQNAGAAMQNFGTGQVTTRGGQPRQNVVEPNPAPSRAEIEAEYSGMFSFLNKQKLILEDVNNYYTNMFIQEIDISSEEIQNLTQSYIERLNTQLRLP